MKVIAATGLIAAFAFLIPAPAEAGVHIGVVLTGDNYRYDHRDTRRLGFDRGYDDGYNEGLKDGRRGDRYGYRDEGRYRDGDHGYRSSFGPRWEYTNGYRSGFESGYRRGFQATRPHYDRRHDDRYDDDRYDDRYRR